MKKTSTSLARILLSAFFVFINLPVQIAKADGAPPPEPDMGGVAPYHPIDTNVQMMSETVVIDALPNPTRWTSTEFNWNSNQVKVHASFTLRNQGKEEEKMQVIFPLTRLDYPWVVSSYNIIGSTFVAVVDGKPVPTTGVTTPPELQAIPEGLDSELPDGFFIPDVQWAGFDVTFPVQEDVIVEVEYDMQGDITTGLHSVDYILETGAGWYGNILSAGIILRLPYPATSESVPAMPAGCSFSGNAVQCNMKNFEPKRKDNLTFGFIDTNEWTPILELRARVEQFPNDANAWYRLAWDYERLGFWHREGQAAIRNQHFADLSKESFEKVIDLNNKWGDAHFGLASVLWYGKSRTEKLTVEDPVVKQVLLEMQLAASYGVTDQQYHYSNLSYEIIRSIPDINQSLLPVPLELTSVAMSPTTTLAPIFDSIQKVVAIAVGNYHTCVLIVDGDVKCRGWNLEMNLAGHFTSVVAGDFYTCMLTTNGGVQCVGNNNFGQLGDGTTTERGTSVDVMGLTGGVSSLVAGDNHVCALMINGGVKCWGRNYFGQLGNGTMAYSSTPVDVHGLSSGVASLVAGNDHTCALMVTGGIKCWGANEAGQLGDGSLVNQLEPVNAVGFDVIGLAAGFAHTCALNSQGQVLCWGDNSHGQLGDGDHAVHMSPTIIPDLGSNIMKVAAGNGYTCALTREGAVKCWGRNDPYIDQLGDGTEIESFTPADVIGLTSDVVDIAVGNNHASALLRNGRIVCWGMCWFGYNGSEAQFGGEPTLTPTLIATTISESVVNTPVSIVTVVPAGTSSIVFDFEWEIGLLAIIGVLFLIIKRSKSRRAI